MKTVKDFEERHFKALMAIESSTPVNIIQDDMPQTMFNLLQIDAAQPNVFFDVIVRRPDRITVKLSFTGQRAIHHFKEGFHQAAKMSEDEDVPNFPFPIDHFFGLTYASYLVVPRLALKSMPTQHQQKMVDLLREIDAEGISVPDDYIVTRPDKEVDPWADYRRGDARKLSENDKRQRDLWDD